ncbi:hypothetical protein [Sphingobium cloacae]
MSAIDDPRRFRRSQDIWARLGLSLAATSWGGGRHQRPHFQVWRWSRPQAAVRSGPCHAIADLSPVGAEGLGCRRRREIGFLKGARCAGPTVGGDPESDVA